MTTTTESKLLWFTETRSFSDNSIRIRLYIKNETSLKKRNLERNRPKKTQPRRRQVSEKKKTKPARRAGFRKKTQPGRRPGCVFFSDIRTLTGYRVMIFFAKKHIINTHMHCHKSLCMYVFSMYVLYVHIWLCTLIMKNKQRK